MWSGTSELTHLNSIGHGADGLLCDIVEAQLKSSHHHAGLQLAPGGQQQSVGTQAQLLLLTSCFPWAEGLSGTERVVRLKAMLQN